MASSAELHASADKDGSIAALREQRAIESTMARWAARMTTLARLMRTLTDDDVESHSRSDNKVRAQNILHASICFPRGTCSDAVGALQPLADDDMDALLADLNRRPLIRRIPSTAAKAGSSVRGSAEEEPWQVERRHIRLIRLARAWPGFARAREHGVAEKGVRGAEDCASASLRAAGRVGDSTWEDECVGEIAGLLLLEEHACLRAGASGVAARDGGGGGGGGDGGENLAEAFPVLYELAMALAKEAANEFVHQVLQRLCGLSSLRRFEEEADTLRLSALDRVHRAAAALWYASINDVCQCQQYSTICQ